MAKSYLAKENQASQSQTRIRSDIIDIKRKSQLINFVGNVVVEKEDSSLLAESMVVIYSEKTEEGQEAEIRRIEAKNNVKIFSEEFIASSDFGYFDPRQNMFVLQKNVIVNNGSSIAGGDKFIYNLTTKKGKFIGNKNETSIGENNRDKRVVVVIGGGDLKGKKQNKNK
jgi:lipopolysaccharide transport protein LptA